MIIIDQSEARILPGGHQSRLGGIEPGGRGASGRGGAGGRHPGGRGLGRALTAHLKQEKIGIRK